jgi:hypothetical protein
VKKISLKNYIASSATKTQRPQGATTTAITTEVAPFKKNRHNTAEEINEFFKIKGGVKLKGEIIPQGAKNEALQVICAPLLTAEPVTIHNILTLLM